MKVLMKTPKDGGEAAGSGRTFLETTGWGFRSGGSLLQLTCLLLLWLLPIWRGHWDDVRFLSSRS
jgi:hypothetical protein